MSGRRTRGGDLKDSKEEGGEEAVAMVEAEASSESEMKAECDVDRDAAGLILNAGSSRDSKKRRVSTKDAASIEFLDSAKSSSEVSQEFEIKSPIDGAGGKVGVGKMQRDAFQAAMDESEMKADASESVHSLALDSGESGGDAAKVAVTYKSVISDIARANNSHFITAENYYLLHWLYRIRNVSCPRGLRISFLQPDFLWSIYRPMMRSRKLWRTDGDIKVAADLWCLDRAAALERYGHISDWDVSSVTGMNRLFQSKTTFNDEISRWDVSNVTIMSYMFTGALAFNQSVGGWDVSKVTDMGAMFYRASSFNQPIGDWDVSKVTDMRYMFLNALAFNQSVGDWDVSNVTNMRYMFCNAASFNQDITRWDLSSVEDTHNMFQYADTMQRDNKPAAVRDDVYEDSDDDVDEGEWEEAGVSFSGFI